MTNYFTEYPTHIEIPYNYWTFSYFFKNEVEYLEKNEND
jgi:hypothetical protein